MRRWWLIICLFAFLHPAAEAQPARMDSSTVNARQFNADAIAEYKKDRQFQYDRQGRQVLSLWDRFWIWFWDQVNRILTSPTGRAAVNSLLVILGLGLLVYFVLKLTGDRTKLFGGKGKALAYQVGEEDIHSISFEDAIREALANNDYRLAVRLIYLLSLKMLSDRGLIDWKPGKTNTAYLYELQGHASERPFRDLTAEFEQAWYGGEEVSQEHYQDIETAFAEFKTSVTR